MYRAREREMIGSTSGGLISVVDVAGVVVESVSAPSTATVPVAVPDEDDPTGKAFKSLSVPAPRTNTSSPLAQLGTASNSLAFCSFCA
jgi:hypothetical protein